ncbi:MAG: hypothetical protein KAJ55_00370 [Anaerolineales bacterium]|nr:hypothetical protein [Anaerolineales bacterium]
MTEEWYGYPIRPGGESAMIGGGRPGAIIRPIPKPSIITPPHLGGTAPAPKLAQDLGVGREITTVSFYPDRHPETTTVDGQVSTTTASGTSWGDIRTGPGTAGSDTGTTFQVVIRCDGNVDKWDVCRRGVATFDLTDYADREVESGEVRLWGDGSAAIDDFGGNGLVLLQSTLVTPTEIVAADFDNFGLTELGTRVLFKDWDLNNGGTFYFNTVGLEYIHLFLGQVVRYGFKIIDDYDDNEPPWVSGDEARVTVSSSEHTSRTGPELILRFRE